MGKQYDYDRVTLYFPKARDEKQQAIYSFLKAFGHHQTEIVINIIAEFLGEENLRDYSDIVSVELLKILKERTVANRRKPRNVSSKELSEIFSSEAVITESGKAQPIKIQSNVTSQPEDKPEPSSKGVAETFEEPSGDDHNNSEDIDDFIFDDYSDIEDEMANSEIARMAASMFDDGQG